MTTLSQTIQQPSPHKNYEERGQPRHIVRWIVIAMTAIAVLGAGAWVLWRTPDLTSVPTVNAPITNTLTGTTEDAQVPGSRPALAQAGADAAVSAAEESATAADEVVATALDTATEHEAVSESPQASSHIVTIAGTDGTVVWPSVDGQLPQTVPVGERLTATARSADNLWLYVQTGEIAGWAETAQLYAFGLNSLPVLETAPNMDAAVNTLPETAVFSAEYALEVEAVTETAIVEGTLVESAVETEEMAVAAVVTLATSRLNVRSGPSTESTIIAKAYPEEEFTAIGRDESGEWLQLALSDVEGGFGWVSAAYITLSEPIATLPVSVESSNAPIFESTFTFVDASVVDASVLAASDSVTMLTSTVLDSGTASASATGLSGTLAFQASYGMIFAYDLESGEVWPLTTGFDPAISPDGTTVAFTRDDGGQGGLYLIGIDGSNEQRIFLSGEILSSPKWSPDGNWIVFSQRSEVAVTDPPQGRGGSDTEIVIVPAYAYQLAVVDRTGDSYHEVASLTSARAADWTTAGIVYQSSSGIQLTADSPDAENQLVTFDYLNPYYYDPDWQPTADGTGGQIVFMQREASHWEIYVVNPDGSGLTALTKPVTTLVDALPSNVAPAYSPDGEQIVYLSNRGGDNSAGAWQLWVMDADGSNAQPLAVTLPDDLEITYTFGNEQAVSWGS